MDTLEYRATEDGQGEAILWRNKTPQDICREQHPDCVVRKVKDVPKSLRTDSQYCEHHLVERVVKGLGGESREGVASLIPIPEKP